MSRQPILLVDADGVLCDFIQAYLGLVHEHTGRQHTHADVTDFDFWRCVVSKEEDDHVWQNMIDSRPGLLHGLDELPGALEGLDALREFGKVICLTSPHLGPHWMFERANWLKARGFSKREIIFASDKSHVSGFVLVDDKIGNCEDWAKANPHGVAILFDQPWNQGKVREGVIRAKGWTDVVRVVRNLVYANTDSRAVVT